VAHWSLDTLDELVQAHGAAFPERLEEWRYYLVYLRDFAGIDRVLPPEFTGLVLEVFGDLIALDRKRG
jgi:hypothetical protein